MAFENEVLHSRVTPYYYQHVLQNATMMKKGGWIRPSVFSTPENEVLNTRNNVGIIDAHSMGKIEIRGKAAYQFVQFVITNDLNRISEGKQGIYTCICNEEGGIVDDVIAYFLTKNRFFIVTNTLSKERVLDWLIKVQRDYQFEVEIIDATNATAYLAIQGPKSLLLINELFDKKVASLKYFEIEHSKLNNVPVLVTRTGFTGEAGFELYFPSEFGHEIWGYILEVGKKYDIKPVGGIAVQLLRTEKGYRAHGTDMTIQDTPFEPGIEWTICFHKEQFIGKEALLNRKEKGVAKKLFGFVVNDHRVLDGGTIIHNADGEKAGIITTCYLSPTLNKVIAMGYVNKEFFGEACFFTKNQHALTVTDVPFYDPKGERVRASFQPLDKQKQLTGNKE